MENPLINVLIVDDEKIVREGIKHLIDWNNLGFCICGEAANGEEALSMIKLYDPGLVLLISACQSFMVQILSQR